MQVLCIDDKLETKEMKSLHVGYIYTVRGTVYGTSKDGKTLGYLLEELHNGISSSGYEYGYAKWHFIPLDGKERVSQKNKDTIK